MTRSESAALDPVRLEAVRLSKSCTVDQYRKYVETRDVDAIAAFLDRPI